MRRHVLHITAALLAFSVGFLTADSYENLAYALPLSLLAFFLAKVWPRLEIDLHFLMVIAMSLLLWSAGLSAFLSLFSSSGGSCVLDFSEEEATRAVAAVPEDTVITLERTGCYGRCPSYTLSIFSDGTVTYYGQSRYGFTRVTGAARSWVSQEQLRQLLSEFERVRYFSLKDRYETVGDGCPTVATDSPSAISSLQINGRKKTIRHYHGCIMKEREPEAFPRELTNLENRVDEITGSERWVKFDD